MRKSKEIILLVVLLLSAMAFVLWYVIDRRANNRAAPPVVTRALAPEPPPVDLTRHDRQTIDFSSGQPVVADTPESRAAIEAALQEMAEAAKDVTFEAAPPAQPPPP